MLRSVLFENVSGRRLALSPQNMYSHAVSETLTCNLLTQALMIFLLSSLLEIPHERNMISMRDTPNNENLALTYHSNTQNQNRFGPRVNNNYNNYYRKNNCYQRSYPIRETKPIRKELCDSGDVVTVDSGKTHMLDVKKQITIPEKQRCLLTDLEKGNKQNSVRKDDERPTSRDLRDSDEIINLADGKHCPSTESKTVEQLPPKKSFNWDEEVTDHMTEMEQLMSNDSHNWKKPFPLNNATDVTVTYIVESPTINCWVTQNQYATKIEYLQDATKRIHSEVGECHKIITDEVYCVQYKDIYYRGVCLYQINSKEVLVRLIDVGLIFQSPMTAIKSLDRRFKTINAFAFEINLETSLDVKIGQTLCIHSFSVDATGTMDVKLVRYEKNIQIEAVPLSTGVPLELFCLDYSNIEKGYISACIHDRKKIESINQLSGRIAAHLENLGETSHYVPKLDEICLVYHDVDQQWYRAECIQEISADSFDVIFIDYGNTRIVNSSNIRKMVAEFTEPAIMHFCCVQGKF